jgi:hypothetical protein
MATINCPRCGAPTKRVARKPYCPTCAWNVNAARREVILRGGAYLLLLGFVCGIAVVTAFKSSDEFVRGIVVGFTCVVELPILVFMLALPLMRLRKAEQRAGVGQAGTGSVGAAGSGAAAAGQTQRVKMVVSGREVWVDVAPSAAPTAPTSASGGSYGGGEYGVPGGVAGGISGSGIGGGADQPGAAAGAGSGGAVSAGQVGADEKTFAQRKEAEEALKRIGNMPVPRPTKHRGWRIFTRVLPAIAFGFLIVANPAIRAWKSGNFGEGMLRVILSEFAIVGALVLLQLYRFWRDKGLVARGALALGRVTRQRTGRYETSVITYAFKDARGKEIKSMGTDYSKRYYEDMWVVVFYDEGNSKKNVAQSCALYEVEG